MYSGVFYIFFFFQAEDGIRDYKVTGVQTCALPIYGSEGLGRSLTMPPLKGNSTVRQADARNLVLAILVGLPKHPATQQGPTPLPGMPGFIQELTDGEVAALANYTRDRKSVV